LGDKIHDVRGISKDETRIRLASKDEISDNFIFVHIKFANNKIIGYVSINVGEVEAFHNSTFNGWLPLEDNKDKAYVELN
jgi:hypothetical protein